MSPKPAFFGNPQYASGEIRGRQIAERLGATYNETRDKNDPPKHFVFVKCIPSVELEDLINAGSTIWFDVVDSDSELKRMASFPMTNIIAIGNTALKYLTARVSNAVFLIKEHHCNFERQQNTRWPPKRAGFAGYQDCFDLPLTTVRGKLAEIGLEFDWLLLDRSPTREDICNFYKTIDIQVTFRGPRNISGMPPELKNPLKVVNAASFGIPTVSYPELNYLEEFPPHHRVHSLEDIVAACKRMQQEQPFFRTDLLERSEEYHIDNIVERYKEVLI